ncbi:hypothetical protein IVB33_10190, partial [Bradyrhizobium sp. 24]|nr:hypothetical protein [Bradyrhizobium sp. 24]
MDHTRSDACPGSGDGGRRYQFEVRAGCRARSIAGKRIGRMRTLARRGLAEPAGPAVRVLAPDAEASL